MTPIKLSFQNDLKIDERFGKYPADWVLHRMGDLGDFFGGATPSTQQPSYWNGSINWLVPSDISTIPEEQKYIYDTSDKITDVGLAACSAVLLPAATVTMSSRATLGDCVIFGKEMCTNQGFISCVCNEQINNEYLLYWIRQNKSYISRYAAGTTFLEIGRRQFKKLRIAIPEPQEQALIVDALADIDRAIEVTRKAIDQADLVKKALMQHLLSGRLKPDGTWRTSNEFYVDEKFGQVPSDWRLGRLKDFCVLQRGVDITDAEIKTGPYPVVRSNGIEEYHKGFIVKGPGVVTGRSGTIGSVFYITSDFWPHNTSLYVKDFKGNHEKYIYYLLISLKFDRYHAGTSVPTLNRNDVHKIRVAIPKLHVQVEIVQILDHIDSLISQKVIKKNALIKLKRSLMQNLLTGKIRVRAT